MNQTSKMYSVLLTASLVLLSACSKNDSGSSGAKPTAGAAATSGAGAAAGGGTPPKSSGAGSVTGVANGVMTPSASCPNPISLEVGPGEVETTFTKLIDGAPGAYVLVGTRFYATADGIDGPTYLSGGGGEYTGVLDETQVVLVDTLTAISCHSSKPAVDESGSSRVETADGYETKSWSNKSSNSLDGNLSLPASISTVDGSIAVFRDDSFAVKNGEVHSHSKLVPQKANVKEMDAEKMPDNVQGRVTRLANGDVVIRVRTAPV